MDYTNDGILLLLLINGLYEWWNIIIIIVN